MADAAQDAGTPTSKTQYTMKKWASLAWGDLEHWAGGRSVSRGRSYQRQGNVRDLAITEDGRLLATVIGRNRYVVLVSLKGGKAKASAIESDCTCPVGYNGCKHAVAVVAEYLDRLANEHEVPVVGADDPRWADLAHADDDDIEVDEDEEIDEPEAEPGRARTGRRTGQQWDEKIRQHINAKGKEDLAELVWSLTQRFPELREEFRERIALGEGDVDRLVAQARKELRDVTSQEAWRNHWDGEGNTPDYSRLLHRLERLLELGHADAVVRLGRELIEQGFEQVGRSHDEGETAMELARCLPIVFKAVAKSTLTSAEKLLFVIGAYLQDGYDVFGDETNVVMDGKYQHGDWSVVADELARRLQTPPERKGGDDDQDGGDGDDFSRNYHRDRISGWLVDALAKAGRDDQVLAVYEKEARATGSYERLVKFLIDQKRFEDAERWATEGIQKTANKLPGIASNLAQALCELAQRRKRWDIAAAHAAWQFFDRPSRDTFEQLRKGAAKAGLEEQVRRLATQFLETGVSPIPQTSLKKGAQGVKPESAWPLPMPDYLLPLVKSERRARFSNGPHYDVLIDMAIAEKFPDEVLRWYDKMCADQKNSGASSWYGYGGYADRVAEAVAKSHPQRSLEIYVRRVSDNLKEANVSAYESVAAYLRKMKPIMKSVERDNEWKQMIEDIRLRHRNRPRFMEILDKVEGQTILSMQKRRR